MCARRSGQRKACYLIEVMTSSKPIARARVGAVLEKTPFKGVASKGQ